MVRSAGIGAVTGALVTLVVSRRSWTRRTSVVTTVVATLLVFSVAVLASSGAREATVRARLTTLLAPGDDPAFRARVDREWPRLLREIRERPLGHGVATTNGPAFEVSGGHVANATDNGYLTLAYELGIPGLLAYVLLLLATAVAAARTSRRAVSPVVRAVCRGGAGAVAALMVAMLAGSYIQLGTIQIVLFTLIGIVSSARWLRSAGP
jgi:O-antigen ligase